MSMQEKYRPSLTAQEIQYIIDRCDSDQRDETTGMSVALSSKLQIFALKMKLGLTTSAYVAAPKQSMEEKLGLEDGPAKRLAAYSKYSKLPSLCTPQEVALAQTYQYENNMMTPEQENEYENRT